MGDRETGSEWSHILGEAMAGPLTGKKLTIVPSSMTNWGSWQAMNRNTTVTMIERSARSYQTERLRNGQRFGIGLVYNGQARIWRFDLLRVQPLVNDQMEGLALVVHFDRKSSSPLVWRRRVLDRVLTFDANEESVQDLETGSTWNMQMGLATSGELEGTRLTALPAIVTFRSAWKRFHPDSTVWLPTDQR